MDIEQLNHSLIEACKIGQIEQIATLLEQGANINHPPFYPLAVAAQFGHLELVKFLIEQGANYNHFRFYDAVESGHLPIVQYVISELLPLEIPTFTHYIDDDHTELKEQCELLSYAIYAEQIPLVAFLLEQYEANHVIPGLDYHCLHYAINKQAYPIVSYLLEKYPLKEACNFIIDDALERADVSLMELMLKGNHIVINKEQQKNMLHHALNQSRFTLIDLLVSQGMDLTYALEQDHSSTYSRGDLQSVKWLVEHGQDIIKPYGYNNYALVEAAKGNNQHAIEYMLSFPQTQDAKNKALLETTTRENDNTIARILINHGAKIDYENGLILLKLIEKYEYDFAKELMPIVDFSLLSSHIYKMLICDHQLDLIKYIYQLGYPLTDENYFVNAVLNQDKAIFNFFISENLDLRQNKHEALQMAIHDGDLAMTHHVIEHYHNYQEVLALILETEQDLMATLRSEHSFHEVKSDAQKKLAFIKEVHKLLQYHLLEENLQTNTSTSKVKL